MRATQFVRRGLVAFAAIATLSLGLSGVASAQQAGAFPENAPGAVIDNGTAAVFNPITGYAYDVVHTDGVPTAVLAVGVTGGLRPVVVEFLPDLGSAAIITPGVTPDIILP
jgi:hypothetical protein